MGTDTLTSALNTFVANGPYAVAAYLLMRWVLNRSDEERKSFLAERAEWTAERKDAAVVLNSLKLSLERIAGQMDAVVKLQERIMAKLGGTV